MCATCGCGKPKAKHGQKTLTAANKKFAKKKALSGKQSKIASAANPKDKITGEDFKALKFKKKVK